MKNPENRLQVDKLYNLGAGASYGATIRQKKDAQSVAPLDKDFCSRLLALNPSKPHWVSHSVEFIRKNWKGYGQLKELGLEEAIITQITQLRFFDAIHKKRKINISAAEYLDHVGHLIVFLLRRTKENNHEPYRKLNK